MFFSNIYFVILLSLTFSVITQLMEEDGWYDGYDFCTVYEIVETRFSHTEIAKLETFVMTN